MSEESAYEKLFKRLGVTPQENAWWQKIIFTEWLIEVKTQAWIKGYMAGEREALKRQEGEKSD